ncbi:hypothetical protein [Haemophilus paraphrohaemolyticus]|uniref:hypothetical protein n=1 Tax=Haemophilus paraphrohaemolyticus TaxID=736 RepID=UPI001CEDC927|nr:hypothetical protein [Haemophilus paraphrohaemolyticus]
MKTTFRFYFSLIYIGIITGLIGVCLTFLLHTIQQLAFDYGTNGEPLSFLEGVQQSEPLRRWLVLTF